VFVLINSVSHCLKQSSWSSGGRGSGSGSTSGTWKSFGSSGGSSSSSQPQSSGWKGTGSYQQQSNWGHQTPAASTGYGAQTGWGNQDWSQQSYQQPQGTWSQVIRELIYYTLRCLLIADTNTTILFVAPLTPVVISGAL